MSETDSNKKSPGKQEIKDYTTELPMFDLEDAVKLVSDIHEKALETATMPEVAKGCGYASPSSTPFYRRIVAARMFKLISTQRAELTKQALDYLKPETEDGKSRALADSISAIPAYADLLQNHQGKRVNLEIVANGFMRKFFLTKPAANLCARAFASSIKFAGLLGPDGTIRAFAQKSLNDDGENPPPSAAKAPLPPGEPEIPLLPGTHPYVLPLPNGRKVIVIAPLDITAPEIGRLKKWIEFTLQVDWSGEAV